MRKVSLFVSIAFFGISLLLVSPVAFGADPIKLTFASASSKGLPTYIALEKYAELVNERGKGKYKS